MRCRVRVNDVVVAELDGVGTDGSVVVAWGRYPLRFGGLTELVMRAVVCPVLDVIQRVVGRRTMRGTWVGAADAAAGVPRIMLLVSRGGRLLLHYGVRPEDRVRIEMSR